MSFAQLADQFFAIGKGNKNSFLSGGINELKLLRKTPELKPATVRFIDKQLFIVTFIKFLVLSIEFFEIQIKRTGRQGIKIAGFARQAGRYLRPDLDLTERFRLGVENNDSAKSGVTGIIF